MIFGDMPTIKTIDNFLEAHQRLDDAGKETNHVEDAVQYLQKEISSGNHSLGNVLANWAFLNAGVDYKPLFEKATEIFNYLGKGKEILVKQEWAFNYEHRHTYGPETMALEDQVTSFEVRNVKTWEGDLEGIRSKKHPYHSLEEPKKPELNSSDLLKGSSPAAIEGSLMVKRMWYGVRKRAYDSKMKDLASSPYVLILESSNINFKEIEKSRLLSDEDETRSNFPFFDVNLVQRLELKDGVYHANLNKVEVGSFTSLQESDYVLKEVVLVSGEQAIKSYNEREEEVLW